MKTVVFLMVLNFFLVSCSSIDNGKSDNAQQIDYVHQLKKHKLGKSKLYLSLPNNYRIEEKEGVDFTVYLFQPRDTAKESIGSGGIYIGGHPAKLGAEGEECKAEKRAGNLLDKNVSWYTYSCEGKAVLETIVEVDDYLKVHVFGEAKSKEDIEKLIHIFSTLIRE